MWGPSTGQGSHHDISQRPGAKPQLPGPGLPGQVQPWKRVRSEPAAETDCVQLGTEGPGIPFLGGKFPAARRGKSEWP